jgi:hypothetical protein
LYAKKVHPIAPPLLKLLLNKLAPGVAVHPGAVIRLIQKKILKNSGHSLVVVDVVDVVDVLVVLVVDVVVVVVVVVCAANNQTNTYFYTFLRDKIKDSYKKAALFHLLWK